MRPSRTSGANSVDRSLPVTMMGTRCILSCTSITGPRFSPPSAHDCLSTGRLIISRLPCVCLSGRPHLASPVLPRAHYIGLISEVHQRADHHLRVDLQRWLAVSQADIYICVRSLARKFATRVEQQVICGWYIEAGMRACRWLPGAPCAACLQRRQCQRQCR